MVREELHRSIVNYSICRLPGSTERRVPAFPSTPVVWYRMDSPRFSVKKFIGKGCYSMVYEVASARGNDKNELYAFKRIFLQNPSAVICAIREHHILIRLALKDYQSPFLPTLFCSFRIHGSPVFVLRRGSGFDLFDLLSRYGRLSESDARFYTSEIICGLEYLHAMRVVHLDLKPENILLSHSGHVLITDFDRSYDITRKQEPPNHDDFCGTPLFMAPEIANGIEITTKADVWSLAILMAEIVSGPVRRVSNDLNVDINRARTGYWKIRNFQRLSKALQSFFNACLKINHKERPDISGIKNLRFYKHVDWNEVGSCSVKPPHDPFDLRCSASHNERSVDPNDPLLLEAAYGEYMPSIKKGLQCTVDISGVRHLVTSLPNTKLLEEAGLTSEKIEELFADFEFSNPVLRSGGVANASQGVIDVDKLSLDAEEIEVHKPFEATGKRSRIFSLNSVLRPARKSTWTYTTHLKRRWY
ncbi:Ribosomal protein S6 kinase alpha-2 [Echinococcus granulosus]|uniref:Ribosomal protein S6 kinase alpha-2 n=1 Tax=Echinococcus granulosus TaxID=6210 RepID=W6USZ3_ECHGR|nr:Ribosomal protein S6 kinase alpha-2 [Echinococcus granulosus]EUB64770.1 Ribosomal protein S6 kinase alpha-2 [Echinococcus granulosus]